MKRKTIPYKDIFSCIFMILTLAWLTVSLPVVYKSYLQAGKNISSERTATENEDASNPANNLTEEKTAGNFSFSEEYLHHHLHESGLKSIAANRNFYHEDERAYTAFHGELLCPPPNA